MQVLQTPAQAAQWLKQCGCSTLCSDSRKAMAGDGFIAWPGLGVDTRQFVSSALSQGANACLVEQEGAQSFAFHDERVAAYVGLKADAGSIASEFFDNPSHKLTLMAVTGTNGKTSTAWWLAQALSALPEDLQVPCAVVGTLGAGQIPSDGAPMRTHTASTGLVSTGFTTPDPVFLQRTLKKFIDDGLMACAIEASSIGIEEHRLAGTRIHTALFTNFTQDHLDYHGSMQAYWQSKVKLFSWPGLRSAVINLDDYKGAELAQQLNTSALDVWTVSCLQPARLQARNVTYHAQGLYFDVLEGDQVVALQTLAMGAYNVSNFLCVIAAMRSLNVPLLQAVRVCSALQPVPGRMQCIGGAGEPLIAVDYAHTPDALENALLTLRALAQGRAGKLWCIFGCGGDRDASKRPLMGAIAAREADHVVVTSDNPRNEKPEAIVAQILLGMSHAELAEVQVDRALAIASVLARADAADVVLLAGKGHEEVQEIAGMKHPFSDKEHALRALQARSNFGQGVQK